MCVSVHAAKLLWLNRSGKKDTLEEKKKSSVIHVTAQHNFEAAPVSTVSVENLGGD